MIKILIVEDNESLNNGIALSLKQEGYAFFNALSLQEARAIWKTENPDLILLDINLPDGSGLAFCKEIRQGSQVPIIFLTANDMETDIVMGFSLGGDDYITKPFSLAVLRARVMAVLKRMEGRRLDRIAMDSFSFDFDAMVFYKNGVELQLSKTEQKLLKFLVMNKGRTLSRELLLDRVWGLEFVDENALTVTISRLRNKLEDSPNKPKYIKTVHGLGYTWSEAGRDESL